MTRQELIVAAGSTGPLPDHIEHCADCREALSLLRAFQVTGRPPLPEPPDSWVARAAEIPRSARKTGVLERLRGAVVFDSWLQPSPVGVRGVDTSDERRICFQAGSCHVDLRAEKHRKGWSMVAQITGDGAEDACLVDGKRELAADHDAIFQWASTRPPTTLSILVGERSYLLPKLSWKRPRTT